MRLPGAIQCDSCTWRDHPDACAVGCFEDLCPGYATEPCPHCELSPCVCYAEQSQLQSEYEEEDDYIEFDQWAEEVEDQERIETDDYYSKMGWLL